MPLPVRARCHPASDASRRQNRSGFHQHQSEWDAHYYFYARYSDGIPCGMEQLTATEAKLIVRQRSRHGQPQKDKWAGTGGTRPCGGRLREVVWPYSLARPAGYRGSKGYIECGWRLGAASVRQHYRQAHMPFISPCRALDQVWRNAASIPRASSMAAVSLVLQQVEAIVSNTTHCKDGTIVINGGLDVKDLINFSRPDRPTPS